MDQDSEHLKMLALFHYIVGGLAALFACFPIMYLVMGIAMVTGAFNGGSSSSGPPPFMGWIFIVMGAFMIVIGWLFAICLIYSGIFLTRRHHYNFCLVLAALSCIFMPFGTVLGVFTIITLVRPSVKESFAVTTNLNKTE